MTRAKFNTLNEEVQKEFLARGGRVEDPPAAGAESLGYMRWGYPGAYGDGGSKHLRIRGKRKKKRSKK